jgi:hypothetical protein
MGEAAAVDPTISSFCRVILRLAATFRLRNTFSEVYGVYPITRGWIQPVRSNRVLLQQGVCWLIDSLSILLTLAQVILVWGTKRLSRSCPIWTFRNCELNFSVLAPEWSNVEALARCMFTTRGTRHEFVLNRDLGHNKQGENIRPRTIYSVS